MKSISHDKLSAELVKAQNRIEELEDVYTEDYNLNVEYIMTKGKEELLKYFIAVIGVEDE